MVRLRGKFKSILGYQDYIHLSLSWLVNNNIQTLVDVANGLFTYSFAVLHHIAYLCYCQFCERLQSVLGTLSQLGNHVFTLPFSQLNTLYIYIMSQILERILPSAQLFLYHIILGDSKSFFHVATVCNNLQLSESIFRDISHYSHTIVTYEASFNPFSSIDFHIDLTQSFFD